MNIIKRLLNVIAILSWTLIAIGIYVDLTKESDKFAIYFGLGVLGVVLTINYILFQNISTWNKVNKS